MLPPRQAWSQKVIQDATRRDTTALSLPPPPAAHTIDAYLFSPLPRVCSLSFYMTYTTSVRVVEAPRILNTALAENPFRDKP